MNEKTLHTPRMYPPLRKYAYYVGKDGPFCRSCAQFTAHIKGERFHGEKLEGVPDELLKGADL